MPKGTLAYQEQEIPIISTNTRPKMEEVRVDMADMKVESSTVELLTSVGSCVALCMHDSKHKCGGLAHVMLPNSAIAPHEPLPSKFADTAVPALAKAIRQISGTDSRITAKIAGGANMFASIGANGLDIGGKNVRAIKDALVKYNIRLEAEDVGGIQGRRVRFNVNTGVASVRHFNGEVKRL